MKLSENNDMQLKKQALRSRMRDEWKQSYFSAVRKSILYSQQHIGDYKQRVHTIINELPSSLGQLVAEMDNQFQIFYRIMVEQIDSVADRLVRVEICDWREYISIINRLLSNPCCQKDVDRVIAHTFLPLMECAQFLADKNKRQRTIYATIMDLCLEYCLRLGQRLLKLNQMQENALQTILSRMWQYQQQQSMPDMKNYDQQYSNDDSDEVSNDQEQCSTKEMKLVQLTNNIICAQFDIDEEQNVSLGEQRDLQIMKICLIQKVFYKNDRRMNLLIQRCFKHSQKGKSKTTLKLYLRLLVNITVYIDKSVFYLPLIDSHLLILLNKLFQNCSKCEMLILAVKLLNNILVNEQKLTQMILKDLMLTLVINLYGSNQNWDLQCQIGQLFSNLIHFMNQDSQLVRSLINLQIDQLLCSRFDYYQFATQSQIAQILSSILIMMEYHPFRLKQLLRREETKLKIIMEEKGDFCAGMIGQILESINEDSHL